MPHASRIWLTDHVAARNVRMRGTKVNAVVERTKHGIVVERLASEVRGMMKIQWSGGCGVMSRIKGMIRRKIVKIKGIVG